MSGTDLVDKKWTRIRDSNIPRDPTDSSTELRYKTLCLVHLSPTNAKAGKKRKKTASGTMMYLKKLPPRIAKTIGLDIKGCAELRNTVANKRLHISTRVPPFE